MGFVHLDFSLVVQPRSTIKEAQERYLGSCHWSTAASATWEVVLLGFPGAVGV